MTRFLLYRSVGATALVLSLALGTGAFAKNGDTKEKSLPNGRPFQMLQSQIDALNADFYAAVADLQAGIDDLRASQAEQDQLIAAIQTAAGLLQQRVAANEEDIAALQAAIGFQNQLIEALRNRLTDLEGRVTVNESDIAAIIQADQITQGLIAAIQAQIANLTARIDAQDGDIALLQDQVASLEGELASLQAQLALTQRRVSGVCLPGSSIRVINANGTVTCEFDSIGTAVGTFQSIRVEETAEIPSAGLTVGVLNLSATCPSTYDVTGGGYLILPRSLLITADARLINVPISRDNDGNGWQVVVQNDNVVVFGCCRIDLTVYATCGRVVP